MNSSDSLLKYTNIEINLLTDIDMHTFICAGIRGGGIIQCSRRHAIAKHKHMNAFNSKKQSELIMYLNANNLYGWAMLKYLPYAIIWLTFTKVNVPENPIKKNLYQT